MLRAKNIKFFILDGFAVAKRHAPTPADRFVMLGPGRVAQGF
jgi:hypothetical protein